MKRLSLIAGIFIALFALTGCPSFNSVIDRYMPPESESKENGTNDSAEGEFLKQPLSIRLSRPLRGRMISGYGKQDGLERNGIGIQANESNPAVSASADGTVRHVGNIEGYGNIVLIEHGERLITVYAHLDTMEVKKDQSVSRGSIIGALRSETPGELPVLYFEVRHKGKPVDPLKLFEHR